MKILLLTHRIPYPLHDGGALGVDYFITGYLQQGVDLSILSFNTNKHFVNTNSLPPYYEQLQHFETVDINTDLNIVDALKCLIANQSYHASRFFNKVYEQKLVALLQDNTYDIVQLDNIYLGHYTKTIRRCSNAKIFCRIHNIEYKIWQKLALHKNASFKKYYLNILWKQLKKYELEVLAQMDLLLTIATEDEKELRANSIKNKLYYMPFGVDEVVVQGMLPNTSNTCFHIGSMNWLPNIEAINFFIENVWPIVQQRSPNTVLHLAGKDIAKNNYVGIKNLHVHENVAVAKDFMDEYNIMVVPLLSGDGIRVKILEGLALGKKIVTTSIGARGINAEHKKHLYIADDPQSFANSILEALASDTNMNHQAQEFVFANYSKQSIFKNAIQFFQKLI